ncbi:MAG TPA: 3-hydroxyacyl-CoA dehydrogenase family protein [Acidimicrobiales bacterium]|nr:3-hydroxyacyl-CoA dehydrogenase family protein [Acidimicrobiales bacterium]
MSNATAISTITVVGSGYMGGGIAVVFALGGFNVILADADADTARRARVRLVDETRGFESLGLLVEGSTRTLDERLSYADSIAHAVRGADYITEAVPEQLPLKFEVLGHIGAHARSDAIIATNTSAISIAELARAVTSPERFLGVHWMNPAPFIPGVELIAGPVTEPEVIERAEELLRVVGKVPARVADTPGFVANRLQFALYKEAARIVEDGVATPAQVDAVVANTFGFRLALFGPFAIGDMAGLDVYESSYRTLADAFGERFAVPASLAAMVSAGHLGIKADRGFLEIDREQREALLAYRAGAYARLAQLRDELGNAPGL